MTRNSKLDTRHFDYIDCGGKRLDLSRPQVMGILNITPDSFSDGGDFFGAVDRAVEHAGRMIAAGAALIDIGGESTRPGAADVPAGEELARVIPVIEAVHRAFPVIISIDTSKPEVMQAAVDAGASFINDVRALRAPGAPDTAARCGAAVCLMHMLGEPRTMQDNPQYDDVVADIRSFLAQRVDDCMAAGIARERLVVDPGFGFGKTVADNLELLRRLDELHELGLPVLAGLSRKSMIGKVIGREVNERGAASIACAVMAVWQGAAIIRAHDVGPTVDAVRMCHAVRTGQL